MGNTFGTIFKFTTFGESHGKAIGGIIDGVYRGIIGGLIGVFIGGIIGSILTGVLLLRLQKYNVITVVMLSLSIIPLLFLKYTNVISYIDINITILGYLLAGPSTIISTIVAVNLSNKYSKVKSTIIGFIDGLGSLGCGLFQIFIPAITQQYGWHYIFYFLIGLICMSIICIICKCKNN